MPPLLQQFREIRLKNHQCHRLQLQNLNLSQLKKNHQDAVGRCSVDVAAPWTPLRSSGVPSERDMPSYLFRSCGPNSPESISASEISDSSYVREVDKEGRHSFQQYEDCLSENLESRCDSFGRENYIHDNGQTSPDLLSMHSPISRRLQRAQSVESFLDSSVKVAGLPCSSCATSWW
nr:uncharacterized protein LOC117838859 [Setaria viridis]